MRTYTQYIGSNGKPAAPWQAIVMMSLMVNGSEQTLKVMAKKCKTTDTQALSAAASVVVAKGWVERPKRGTYRLTPKGRQVWTWILRKERDGRYAK